MTSSEPGPDTLRTVDVTRIERDRYRAVNVRGGELTFGSGDDTDFTPVELLLVALAGCSAIDVDAITGKRAAPEHLSISASGHKIRDEKGNHLVDLRLVLDAVFPEGEQGDAARAVLPRTIEQVRDRLCTVSRTVALGEPVALVDADAEVDADVDAEVDAEVDAGVDAGAEAEAEG